MLNDNYLSDEVLEHLYMRSRLEQLNKNHLCADDIHPIIEKLSAEKIFDVQEVGLSFQQRRIFQITVGHGPVCILAWSQMHGDEPTATASLLDLMSFLVTPEGKCWYKTWSDKVSIVLVPMLNPDGAQQRTRVNGQGIDINRDANRLQSPEGKLLRQLIQNLKPDIGFNLHDQSRYYTVSENGPETAIAFMAPPADEENSLTAERHYAKQLIGWCIEKLSTHLATNVAKYDDKYSSRAFGDYAAASGIACILIESGRKAGDPNRQLARKINFLSLVHVINAVNHNPILTGKESLYDGLPVNTENGITDVVLRGVTLGSDSGQHYTTDINIQFDLNEQTSSVAEIGDMSLTRAYFEFNAQGLVLRPACAIEVVTPLVLENASYLKLMKKGLLILKGDSEKIRNKSEYPVICDRIPEHTAERLVLSQQATFTLARNGTVCFAVLDGIIVDLEQQIALNAYTY